MPALSFTEVKNELHFFSSLSVVRGSLPLVGFEFEFVVVTFSKVHKECIKSPAPDLFQLLHFHFCCVRVFASRASCFVF